MRGRLLRGEEVSDYETINQPVNLPWDVRFYQEYICRCRLLPTSYPLIAVERHLPDYAGCLSGFCPKMSQVLNSRYIAPCLSYLFVLIQALRRGYAVKGAETIVCRMERIPK